MDYKILVPSGIGDFSWLWSKLVTLPDNFHIQYMGGYPDRLRAFLSLLPKERILSFGPSLDYCTHWDKDHQLVCRPREATTPQIRKATCLADLREDEMVFLENNSFLEAGNSLAAWWHEDIPGTDFHYEIDDKRPSISSITLTDFPRCYRHSRSNYFIVNFSSYGTKKAWGYYDVPVAAALVRSIAKKTGLMPFFIGGAYDDFTRDIYELIKDECSCISLIGRTPGLKEVIALLQQSRFYFGACSGLMVLTNILYVPVITYYPPFPNPPGRKLSGCWHDPQVPHLGLFWEGAEKDEELIFEFLNNL